jgi:hypothetical protein
MKRSSKGTRQPTAHVCSNSACGYTRSLSGYPHLGRGPSKDSKVTTPVLSLALLSNTSSERIPVLGKGD